MAQRPLWWLTVAEVTQSFPYLWKVRLKGESLSEFPRGREGDYVKLLLPKSPQVDIREVDPGSPDLDLFYKRSFTVSELDERSSSLVLYVSRHQGPQGPAAQWLSGARPGDAVLVTGPGPVDQLDPEAKRFLLIGDLPSFGALLAQLRRLPLAAQGDLIFEAPETPALLGDACPRGIQIHHVSPSSERSGRDSLLLDQLQSLKVDPDGLGLWAACEYSNMKALRDYFVFELNIERSSFYLSSYFKRGASDEQHKKTRRDEGYKD